MSIVKSMSSEPGQSATVSLAGVGMLGIGPGLVHAKQATVQAWHRSLLIKSAVNFYIL